MKFLKVVFLFIFLSSNALAGLTYKQSSASLNSVTLGLRGINFNPDGTKMYVTGFNGNSGRVAQYSLSVPYSTSSGVSLDANTITEIAAVLERHKI